MKKLLFLVLVFGVLMFFVRAHAGELTLEMDTYVARGASRLSDSVLAGQEACNDARKTLIGSVFGEVVQINQNAVRTFGVVDYAEDTQVSSERVQLVGWTQEIVKKSGRTVCIIRYPQSEAEVERQRLKGQKSKATTQYTEIGDASLDRSGTLEVLTFPSNANIFIDHERWGTTPLRLKNKLSEGEHLLRIELPNFDPIEETIQIRSGIRTKVTRNLKRSTAVLSILSNPSGADIFVNDEPWGKSPIENREVLSGQSLVIQIHHPQAETYSQTLELSRSETKELNISLPLKPAYLSFQVEPKEGVRASLNGNYLPNWTRVKISAGEHILTLEKDGYREEEILFVAEGNKTTVLKTIELKRLTKSERRLEYQAERAENPSIIINYGAYVHGSTLENSEMITSGTRIGIEYYWAGVLGISTSYYQSTGSSEKQNGVLGVHQSRTSVGIPIILVAGEDRRLIFEADYSMISSTYSSSNSSNTLLINQDAYGIWFRTQSWASRGLIPIGLSFSIGAVSAEDSKTGIRGATGLQLGLDLCLGF